MLEEFKDGVKWRAKNGFRSGFFGAVKVLFHKMFLGTTIRANPNIELKVKNWKEKYGLLADMQSLSGFGWNHDTHSVIVDSEDVWFSSPYPTTPTSNVNHTTPISHATANPKASTTNPPPKKAKKLTRAEAKQAALSEQLAIYMQENKEVMEKLVVAVGFDQKLSDKRNLAFGMLENLNLEVEDMLTTNAMILAKDQKVEEFHTIPERYMRRWVGMLLQGKLNQKTT
ncbi:hypothetical protein Vadar_033587 [Vaccinium darrowii]|uniref:Uncharacterized protein n=1 Tax=Vaccinium darrowii TaxID=229202 RepID=A0ACB7Z8R5_9ERIC|nr:hypothetical protein Vadar_033587 [Vaccinium darrowii]